MSNKECNFKVKNNKPGGDKTPKWFIDFYNKDYKPFQEAFIEFQKQMLEFVKEQRQFNQYVLDQFKRQEQFNKAIMVRLDNLVAKNNLKE